MQEINAQNDIVPVSGYRSMLEQTQIFKDSLKENGTEFTEKFVVKPGCSEHQTGLVIDLRQNIPPIDFIRPDYTLIMTSAINLGSSRLITVLWSGTEAEKKMLQKLLTNSGILGALAHHIHK